MAPVARPKRAKQGVSVLAYDELRNRRSKWRGRCRLASRVVVRTALSRVTHGNAAEPGSLGDCERMLSRLLRHKRTALPMHARSALDRFCRSTHLVTVKTSVLYPDAATWLLWAMSWRGVSTAQQTIVRSLHPPILLVKWWTSMPASLCFGPAGPLLRALCDCVERMYYFWRSVTARMRSYGTYLLDPRLVSIQFASPAESPSARN